MDFELNQDQLAIRDMVRDFARNEIAPHAPEWDEKQHFPRELFTQMGELGLLGVVIPEEYGGAGLGYVEYVAILEEVGRSRRRRRPRSGCPQLTVHESPLPFRTRRAETGVPAPSWRRASGSAPGVSPSRAPGRTPAAPSPPRCATATSGCSTARRTSSPTPPRATAAS